MMIKGYYLDGQTSKRVPARLEIVNRTEAMLRLSLETIGLDVTALESTEKTFLIALHDLTFESRLGNTPREIIIAGEQLFVSDDNDGVDALLRAFKSHAQITGKNSVVQGVGARASHSLLYKVESNLSMIIVAAIFSVAMMWAFFVFALPALSKSLAFKLPDTMTQKLGSSLPILDKTIFDDSELSAQRQAEIQQLFLPYIEQYPKLNAQIIFRAANMANAFSLPNGDIVFTDKFIELADNDDELIAVFFHELGHLQHRHLTRRAIQGSLVSVVIFFMTGDLDTADAVIGLPTLLADMAYSRDFEREADAFALQALQDNHIPVQSFANIMEKLTQLNVKDENSLWGLRSSSTVVEYLSSHPSPQERIDRVKQLKEVH